MISYLGVELRRRSGLIEMQQFSFIDKLGQITYCDDIARNDFRSLLGQLQWIASCSRPDIAFRVSRLSMVASCPSLSDFKRINKIVRYVQNQKVSLRYSGLDRHDHHGNVPMIYVYSDASFDIHS